MNFKVGKEGQLNIDVQYENNTSLDNNKIFENLKFEGRIGQTFFHLSEDKPIAYLGLGKLNKLNSINIRTAFYKLSEELASKYCYETINIDISSISLDSTAEVVGAIVDAFSFEEYNFDKYLSEKKSRALNTIYIYNSKDVNCDIQSVIDESVILNEAIATTKNLINTPSLDMYPEVLSNEALNNLEDLGVEVKVYGQKEIEEIGMKAFLAVSKGSDKEPKFIIMEYNGDSSSDKKIAYVGKGLTYDSGGYSIKPSNSMMSMKSDMSGASTVIGAMKAISSAGLKVNVVGVIAACENMISGGAYKPGDVVGSLSGKTIEIGNTDAEGRVTLADALYYTATKFEPDFIVDLATLTGACIVALGDLTTGAITNDSDTLKRVQNAAEQSDERIWELPNFEEYKEYIKSDIADITNMGKIGAGAVTAGLFLGEFVNDLPWVHLDIAGTSYLNRKHTYYKKGATAYHVKTLYNLAKDYS